MLIHIIYLHKFSLIFELNMQQTYSPQLDNNKQQTPRENHPSNKVYRDGLEIIMIETLLQDNQPNLILSIVRHGKIENFAQPNGFSCSEQVF